jgi:hypothetical protein
VPWIDGTNAGAFYGQVGVWDAESADYPLLHGRLVAATESAIAVAVPGGPNDPPTRLEFWTDPAPTDRGLRSIWSGLLTIGESGAKAGNWPHGQVDNVDLPPGTHRVDVSTSLSLEPPALVRFVLRLEPPQTPRRSAGLTTPAP